MTSEPPRKRRAPFGLRVLAGAAGGIAGGLLFGVLMVSQVIARVATLDELGLVPFGLASGSEWGIWLVHLGASAVFGIVYSLAVPSRRLLVTLPAALAWGALLWAVSGFLAAEPGIGFALTALLGHLAYGAGLGLAYPLLWREELSMLRPDGSRPAAPP